MKIEFGEFTLNGLRRINVLLGKNGCGKSTLLKKLDESTFRKESGILKYITPERGGILKPEPQVELNMSNDETYISSQYDKPVMVHRYPAEVKAFYMEPDPQRADLALCVDVLAPEGYGEVIGGGERAVESPHRVVDEDPVHEEHRDEDDDRGRRGELRMEARAFRDAAPFTLGPEAVLAKLVHALESPRPRARYPVTVPAHLFWWLKRLLPVGLLDRALAAAGGSGKR